MCEQQLEVKLAEQQNQLEDALKHHKLFVQRARRVTIPFIIAMSLIATERVRAHSNIRLQRRSRRRPGGGCGRP
jgi:hypothetical protein